MLCGPNGVVNFLPDHMHEGLCEAPADLSRSYTFDGYTTTEYPTVDGHQESPQVIAWATNHVTESEFGVLAAYDGHKANVGRVVVDATWHHWFNINLTGFLAATDPESPGYDPSVVPKWEEIKAYFRNVAAWLARTTTQRCLRNGGWISIIGYHDVAITFHRFDRDRSPLIYYWQLGVFARDALGRLASQCQQTEWLLDLFKWLEVPEPIRVDPWRPLPPRPQPDPPPWFDLDDFENAALGGMIDSLAAEFGDTRDPQRLLSECEDDIEAVALRGGAKGISLLLKEFQKYARATDRLAKVIETKC